MNSVFDSLRFSAVALDVATCAHASQESLASRQRNRLSHLLLSTLRDSRFYRERLNGDASKAVLLSEFPMVSRGELMARFDDWVTDPQLKLDQLRAFTTNPQRIGEPYLGKYLLWESSGTSNEPGMFVQDAQSMSVYDALQAQRRSEPRPFQKWFDPLMLAERIAFVGATSGHFSSIVTMLRLRQVNPLMAQRLRCFSIMQSPKALVNELNAYAPTVIATYPTVAALLADEFCRGTLRFRPQEIWTGGETLTDKVRAHVEQTLGCAVRNSYGASEFMLIGSECSHGRLHANTDWVILEPIDERGRPVPAGQPSHSTLLTNLANYVQPLIRYDLGDQVTLHTERCGCGSVLPVIDVQGRRDDALLMRGQNGDTVTLLPLALTTVFEDDAGVFNFQLQQHDDCTLVLTLEACGLEGQKMAERCQVALEHFGVVQGLVPIHLIVKLGQVIAKGRSGKAQRILAQVQPDHH
jgi:phenylacetate-coenzyme A ligase PaaK-like adenylate-forming protein